VARSAGFFLKYLGYFWIRGVKSINMNLLLFGGNSIRNKDWIYSVEEQLKPYFEDTKVHHYRHWESGEESININSELDRLSKEFNHEKDYVIFAKSIGTVLAAKGISSKILHPTKCVFLGLPMVLINKNLATINEDYESLKMPILFVQNVDDPLGSGAEVSKYLAELKLSNYRLKELKGSTHDYTDFNIIKSLVKEFVK
jgi:hypothetical protein